MHRKRIFRSGRNNLFAFKKKNSDSLKKGSGDRRTRENFFFRHKILSGVLGFICILFLFSFLSSQVRLYNSGQKLDGGLNVSSENVFMDKPEDTLNYRNFQFSYVPSMIEDADKICTFHCHYSDQYFMKASCGEQAMDGYNPSLATASLCFAMTCFNSNNGGKSMEDADYAAARKYQNVESFLENAGFSDFYYNDWYDKKPRTDSIGVAFGNKQISDSDTGETFTLIAAGIRGGGYEREWVGNVTAGERGFHQGFKTASDQVLSELKYYIEQHEIAGDVKIWITGYSRAAATANLTAGALDDGFDLGESVNVVKKNIYAYCFEAPMGAYKEDIGDETAYYNIYNILNKNDIVTKVAMEGMGFCRYGIDYWLPSGITDGNGYPSKRSLMLEAYNAIGAIQAYSIDSVNDDCQGFTRIRLSEEKLKTALSDYTNSLSEGIITDKVTDLADLLREKGLYEQDHEALGVFLDEAADSLTFDLIQTRNNYVENIQPLLREIMEIVGEGDAFWEQLRINIGESDFVIPCLRTLDLKHTNTVIKKTKHLDPSFLQESREETIITLVKSLLEETWQEAEMPGEMDSAFLDDLKKVISKMSRREIIISIGAAGQVIRNRSIIASAHYTELCLAWLITQDVNYVGKEKVSCFDGNGSYRIVKVNCPADVKVYDESDTLVAEITDNKPQDVQNSSIIAVYNADGEKVVYLPSNAAYHLRLEGTDTGLMSISFSEYQANSGGISWSKHYEDIPVEDGSVYEAELKRSFFGLNETTPGNESQAVLKDDGQNLLVPSTVAESVQEVNKQSCYVAAVSADIESGFAGGSGTRYRGDCAQVTATPLDGYVFDGWYNESDQKISDERAYRFKVGDDIVLTARFTEDPQKNSLPLIWRRYWADSILTVVIILVLCRYLVRVVRRAGK